MSGCEVGVAWALVGLATSAFLGLLLTDFWVLVALHDFDPWLMDLCPGLPLPDCLMLVASLASESAASPTRRRADAGGRRDEGGADHLATAAKQAVGGHVLDGTVDRLIAWAAGEFEAKIFDADSGWVVVDREGADHDPHPIVGLEELGRQIPAKGTTATLVHGGEPPLRSPAGRPGDELCESQVATVESWVPPEAERESGFSGAERWPAYARHRDGNGGTQHPAPEKPLSLSRCRRRGGRNEVPPESGERSPPRGG